MDADPGAVYLLETAKDRLGRDLPGYRMSDVDAYLEGLLAALRCGYPPSAADIRAATFPLTKWRTGYVQRDVDRLIGELVQLVGRPESDVGVLRDVRDLVDRIRTSRFGTTHRGGYDEREVDEFLDRIMDKLTRGERGTLRQLAGEARFTAVRLRPGYRMADVDGLLTSVEQALADLGTESDVDVPRGVRDLVDRIRTSRFGTTRWGGYGEEEVDAFLDRIMGELTRGKRGALRQLAGEASFPTVRGRPGYRAADVDGLLASVEHALADLGW